MPRSSIFSILLLLICFALPSFSRDVYIDSESTSSEPSGSQANPYSSLQQLITILEDPETNEGIQVYLKPRSTVYKISNTDVFLFDGSNNGELSITSWHSDPLHVQNETDCASLPIIDGSEINLDLESLNILNFTSIKFINMKGSIQVKNSKAVFLNDLCLDDLPSVSDSFFNLEETSNLTVHRVIATVSNGTEIIKYTHTKSTNIDQKVSIKDLTLLLINNTNKLSADTLNESYFKFILNNPNSLSATKNTLSLSRVSLQGKGTSQVFPVFLSVYGWDNVNINKLDISDQDFIANRGGVLEFNGVGKLNVSDTYFYHNVIFSQSLLNLKEKISFFYLKNCGSLSFFNTTFENNYISGVQDIETNFRFMLSDVLSSITVKDFKAKGNSVFCLMYLLRIKTINVDVPISMNFDNITIEDNENDNSNFYFLKFSEAKILSFQASNFYVSQNHLSGRLFEISTLGNINLYGLHLSDTVISHKVANFTNMAIVKNSNFTNFAMLLFRVNNPNTIPNDFVPDYEYYTLNFHNLTIEKNNFFKGADKDWLDQLSLLQVSGAQVYIQNSTIKDSLFVSYDFLSLYKEFSSVFFVNSTVEGCIFNKAHFIITRYEAIMVTMGSFFNSSDGRVQALYRYGYVVDSTFTDIEISGGSLFTINNAFVLFNSNNFTKMFFLNSRLIKAGDFRPPGYNIDDVKYIRNPAVEKQSMSINPALYDLYLSSLTLLQGLYQDTVYFYLLRSNRMTRFDVFSKNLIKFEDFEAKQSFICCISNSLYDFNVPDTSTNLIDLSGSVEAFNFYRNTVDKLDGDGAILRFTSLVDNKYFMFRRNIIRNTWGPSILVASGAELSTMNITDNTVHDNIFSNSVISLSFDMILLNHTVFFVNNTYLNNTIVVSDVDLNSKSAFIELSLEASKGGEFFIIDRCNFTDTTYLNNRTFLQYGQLNAMFSFLMANSSLLIKDSIFDKVNIISPGNDAFYVASSLIVVLNSTFNNHTVQSGQSIFNLVSTTGIFRNNVFNQIFIPFGKSIMYISPSPFLQELITLDMTENQFIHCKCGLENVRIAANVLLVEKANITLSLMNNIFSDAFQFNPIFYFLNTTFVNSIVTNSTLQSIEIKNDENFMYEVYYSTGSVQFINETIEHKIASTGLDFLIKCTESPSLSIVLSDLTWAEGSFKNSIRLADMDSGSLTILDTVIDDFTYYFRSATEGMIIHASSSKPQPSPLSVTLKNVTFSNLRLIKSNPADKSAIGVAGFMGSGGQRDTIWNFEIINCTFDGLNGVAGVYIDMPTVFNILIKDSLFNAISGRFGTAIDFFPLTSYKSKIIITNNTFSNNYASKAGGAVYLTNSSYVMTNNTFINNKASDLGGAILLDSISRTDALMQDNIFEGNKANLGDDVASQPYKLDISFIFPNQTTVYAKNGHLVGEDHHHPATIRNISRVALNVSLLDLDSLPTQDTSSTATRYIIINFKNHATITSFNCTKQYCYINSLNLTLSGLHGAPLGVTIQFFSELATSANFRLQSEIAFNIHPCDAGESFNENTKTCDYCGVGTYSLDPKVACQNCPDNAYCPGGNIIVPQKGYWLANAHTSEITQCRKDGITRCNASRELSEGYMEKQCNPGYSGPRCEACDFDKHYVESGLLQCKKCKNVLVSFAATLLMALGTTFWKLYCVRKLYLANKSFCSTEGDELDKLERTESNYYVRLLILYTQILSLLYLFHMEVREFFGEYTHFGNPSEFMLVKLECSMEFLGIPYYQFIYVSTVITFLAPFLQYLSIFILAKLFSKRLFEEASEAKYFFRLCVLYLVMSEQPKVVGFMTSYLSCTEVEGFLGSFIALHPNVSCDDSQYSLFKNFIVIPCLLFWTVGIPLYFFFSLFFRRQKLQQLGVRVSLGGLYNVYKNKHYYWGTVTMALQVSISYVTYAFQEDLKTSLATVFIILWTYQLIIRKHKPYGLKRFNTMESTTIGVLMLNIILGYYTLNNPFANMKYSAYGALALVNIMMLVWIFYKIVHMKIARYLDVAVEKFSSKKQERKSFLDSSRASLLEKDHELTAEEEDNMFLNSKAVADSDSKPINENNLL